ncbi:bifunctional DNA-formamidopyrimidine glycosylase/DNA-(apurinic or apyrimidinic site) lyase [Rhodoferax sp.]|uniref:bifunctional DNA-formamidopyrimidine glycosylase/DNA-(apurinic or apyrimidinic site) lyase n=1 Tax=Rhodoferax sp. TaxID=50421 RepID=UPI00284C3FAF|nr:bifunctional DNA-formamidopyrimidine glycosylase/DNA-(apurinic or apyrimidinic site) lyase [Rhodoferax sp.]MDR3371193.1 bifunctional DNA-formamidopyrimidine glycosylase/DNA-(apurinic or apyrimidinic site) lyase [Rhodoferax sp.]
MPELPEVEVTRRSFVHAIEGARITTLHLGKPLRWPLGCLPETLVGRTVRTVGRRGKYLLIELNQGWLVLHLGMSGSLRFAQDLSAPSVHDHMDMRTTRGTLRLNDPRRFGAVVYVDSLASPIAMKLLGHLGMEPLSDDFDLARFRAGLKQKVTAIKQVLMAGELVVGVGNIYASEALFLAGIQPTCRANKLSKSRVARLYDAIRDVLARAVEQGGSTLRDFSNANGEDGYFQLEAMVYGRAGQPCRQCGTLIKMIRQGQRSTFYCPACQKS